MDKDIKQMVTYNRIEYDKYTSISADINGQSIGICNYSIKSGNAWLYIVRVAEPFRKYGIGGNLLKLMENDCVSKRVREIEGKYYPDGAEDNVVRAFYDKHGYSIYNEGYEHYVSKYGLKHQDVSNLNITDSKGIEK